MLVKDLILKLQEFDPEAEVQLDLNHCIYPDIIDFDYDEDVGILTITQGNCGL